MLTIESWTLSFVLNAVWQIPAFTLLGYCLAPFMKRIGAAAEHRLWVSILLMEGAIPACSAFSWRGFAGLWIFHAHTGGPSQISVSVGPGIGVGAQLLSPLVLGVLAASYCAVTVYLGVRFGWMAVRAVRLRQGCVELQLTGESARIWRDLRSHFEVGEVKLATSKEIFAPITLGWRRPLVAIPAKMAPALGEEELGAVLAHELAHIRRRDFAKNLGYELFSIPVRFHPVLPFTRQRILETREMICDQMSAGAAESPIAYARSLLRLAALLVHGAPVRVPHAIGIFDAYTLERRLMRLRENHKPVRGLRRFATLAGCTVMLCATCAGALSLRMHLDPAAAFAGDADKSGIPTTVSAKEMQDHRISGPPPVYPVDAKKAAIQGKVVLNAVISKEGKVERLDVVSGPKELQQSALDAVRQWEYKPYMWKGQPIEIKTTVNVTYSLSK